MKTIFLSLLCLGLFIPSAFSWANPVTFNEVRVYFSHKVIIHDPGNPSTGTKPFDYPGIDILPLWNRLGLNWQKEAKNSGKRCVFGCKATDTKCFLPDPALSYFSRKGIEIIHITRDFQWDHQYLIFKNGIYIGHLDYTVQKYNDPDLILLDDNLFSIKALYGSGSGILDYRRDVYQINDRRGVKKVLTYMDRYERFGWGAPYDIEIGSKSSYGHRQLKVKYHIKVMQGFVPRVNEEALDQPIVKDNRTIIYRMSENGFIVDTKASDLNPDALDKFDENPGFLYLTYKPQFDRLKEWDKEDRQWYDYFLKSCKQRGT